MAWEASTRQLDARQQMDQVLSCLGCMPNNICKDNSQGQTPARKTTAVHVQCCLVVCEGSQRCRC